MDAGLVTLQNFGYQRTSRICKLSRQSQAGFGCGQEFVSAAIVLAVPALRCVARPLVLQPRPNNGAHGVRGQPASSVCFERSV